MLGTTHGSVAVQSQMNNWKWIFKKSLFFSFKLNYTAYSFTKEKLSMHIAMTYLKVLKLRKHVFVLLENKSQQKRQLDFLPYMCSLMGHNGSGVLLNQVFCIYFYTFYKWQHGIMVREIVSLLIDSSLVLNKMHLPLSKRQ